MLILGLDAGRSTLDDFGEDGGMHGCMRCASGIVSRGICVRHPLEVQTDSGTGSRGLGEPGTTELAITCKSGIRYNGIGYNGIRHNEVSSKQESGIT